MFPPVKTDCFIILMLYAAVYNLTITELVNKDGFCYTWDQTTAKRSAN